MPNQTLQLNAASRARAWHSLVWALLLWAQPVCALAEQPLAQRVSLRYSAGASLMLSRDQRAWLGYSAPGVLSDLQFALRMSPLLAAHFGIAGGVFFSRVVNGAVIAPMLGGSLHWPLFKLPTFVALSVGAAFTGDDVRPFARAELGINWALSSQFEAGPLLGVDMVQQTDGQQFSTNAIYAWLGLSLAFHPARVAPLPVRKEVAPPARPDRGVVLPPPAAEVVPDEELAFELSRERAPVVPSSAIRQLIDEAVHVEHTELLAPVLFEFDSTELEPSSVAMLHEVARMLNQERKDIQLLAVIAYSDAQGAPEYNLQLSQRRAQHVRAWLVAHGIAAERLSLDARGATEPVEAGEAADQQQNRRVVFRVLRAERQP